MRLRVGRPRAALVVAPHPDDETIGAYGLLRALRRRGAALRVVVVSDGAASHPGSARWPRDRLVRERRRETLRAMRGIGIAADAVRFLALPDGALPLRPDACRRKLAAVIRRMPRLDLIVGPVAGDDHADHRTVAAALRDIAAGGARRLGYPVWPAGAISRGRALVLSAPCRQAKRRAIRSYRTQAGLIADDPLGFAMTGRQIAAFSRASERYEEVAWRGRSR